MKKNEASRFESILGEVKVLEGEKKVLLEQLGVIEKLERGRRGPVYVMDEMATIIPKRVWLDKIRRAKQRFDNRWLRYRKCRYLRVYESFG